MKEEIKVIVEQVNDKNEVVSSTDGSVLIGIIEENEPVDWNLPIKPGKYEVTVEEVTVVSATSS